MATEGDTTQVRLRLANLIYVASGWNIVGFIWASIVVGLDDMTTVIVAYLRERIAWLGDWIGMSNMVSFWGISKTLDAYDGTSRHLPITALVASRTAISKTDMYCIVMMCVF